MLTLFQLFITLFYTTLLPFFVYGVIQCTNPPPPPPRGVLEGGGRDGRDERGVRALEGGGRDERGERGVRGV